MKLTQPTLILALFVAILSLGGVRAEEVVPASTNAPAQERFLVIVEASAAMQKRAENTQKALGSVISLMAIVVGSTLASLGPRKSTYHGMPCELIWMP